MRLGVDFGTTNSAIALYDGTQLVTVHSDPANDNPEVMPSLLYIERRGRQYVGSEAAREYLKRETGRRVRWVQRAAGEINITVASFEGEPIDFVETVNVLVDAGANGKLMQSIKTALFNPSYDGTRIFKRYYRVEDLIAIVLQRLRLAAEAAFRQPIESVVLGRPVRFSERDTTDSRAEAILYRAAQLAGFKDVTLMHEPVGVVYLHHSTSRIRRTALVFDFGGGTLDLTIARMGGDTPPEIVASRGVLVGGDDLDRRIMESLFVYFGADENRSGAVLPPDMADKLHSWQTIAELSRPENMVRIKELQRAADDPSPFYALESLVSDNLGFKLFKEIEQVKKRLSTETETQLVFKHGDIHIDRTFTRRRFERLIAGELAQVESGVWALLADAGMRPAEVNIVLRTGGTSLVPAFSTLLVDIFGEEKLVAVDPLVSVVGGFAVAAHEGAERRVPGPGPEAVIAGWQADGGPSERYVMALDERCYSDRDFLINRIPPALVGLPALRLANADRDVETEDYLRLQLGCPARVYVAYDASADLPRWLQGFVVTPMHIELDDSYAHIRRLFRVFSRDFDASPVTLGGNHAAGYGGDVPMQYLVLAEAR